MKRVLFGLAIIGVLGTPVCPSMAMSANAEVHEMMPVVGMADAVFSHDCCPNTGNHHPDLIAPSATDSVTKLDTPLPAEAFTLSALPGLSTVLYSFDEKQPHQKFDIRSRVKRE